MAIHILAIVVILLALCFTYTNGFQDGSSVGASAIASRALRPAQAIVLVALFEFLGALFGGSAVAGTIQSITSWPARADLLPVLISALLAAIVWNFLTKKLGLPSSSTHALVGGILGALCGAGGMRYIVWGRPDLVHPSGVWKVIITLFVSPVIGFIAGGLCLMILLALFAKATMRINPFIRLLQAAGTALLAFAHGANDPQKTMGIIMLSLHATGLSAQDGIPLYVRLAAGVAMVLGVLSLAPSIVKRVARIYRMRTLHGLSVEIASGSVVLFGSLTGGPVAASQVISSSVMGVGSAARARGVHWLIARDMLLAWLITIPCSAVFSICLYTIIGRPLCLLLY